MGLHVDIRKKLASFDLEVCLDAGSETVGFLGESGCGKSMTLRCIAGIETPDEGRIVVNDVVYFDSASKMNLTPQQRKTALLFQNYMLFPHMTVADNIGAGLGRETEAAERKRIIERQLEHFSLQGLEKRYPLQLSGGQQQRVALARMLAANPGILMLDEPFSALDAHLKGVLEQNLVSLFDEYEGPILYVSHDIDEAIRFCDSIAVVEAGHIMERGSGGDLVNNPQSMAGLRLTGCKNAHSAEKVDDHAIYCPTWGVCVHTEREVPDDVRAFGIREFYLERATEPGENVFRVRVDRVSDSRFERSVLLRFLDSDKSDEQCEGFDELEFLHSHMNWALDLVKEDRNALPRLDEELLVRLPAEKIYLVAK